MKFDPNIEDLQYQAFPCTEDGSLLSSGDAHYRTPVLRFKDSQHYFELPLELQAV